MMHFSNEFFGIKASFFLRPFSSECILESAGQKFPYVVNHAVE